jgi:signal transduction histidine kinase/ActR/RegA family two-component response regulator
MSSPHAPEIQAEAEEAMLRLRTGSSNRVLAGVMGAGLVIVALGWSGDHWHWLAVWMLMLMLSQAVRIWTEVHAGNPASGRTLAQRIDLARRSALLSGTTQTLSLGFFPFEDAFAQSLHTLILLVISTGAVVYTAGHPRTYYPFMAPIMLGLPLAWWTLSSAAQARPLIAAGFGALILVYGYNLIGYARDTWTMFLNAAAMRHHEAQQSSRLSLAVKEAEAASHAKTRFLAAASHDLRQPIHTIALLAGVLKLRHARDDSAEAVRLLDAVVQSLSRQLDDLLDISKLDAGVVKVATQPLALNGFLRRRLDEVRSEAEAKGLNLQLEASAEVTVDTDPNLLERVVRNLLSNAVKFTDRGRVLLCLSLEDGLAVLRVQDTGRGIAAMHQREVFQEFVQLDNPERDRSKGMGLGLSIVERLCRLMDIEIRLTSQPGEGSTFELRLPLLNRPLQPERQTRSPKIALPTLTVLVVDDEITVRTATALLLEELGCRCMEAEDLDSALVAAKAQRPDFLMVDYRLRGAHTGIDVVTALRSLYPHLPAAVVSGDIGQDQLKAVEAAGLVMLHKPCRLETVMRLLADSQVAGSHQQTTAQEQ